MDHPLSTLHPEFHLAVEQDLLADLKLLLKILMLVIPQEKEKAGFITHDGLEHPAAAARHEPTPNASKLPDGGVLFACHELANLSDLAPILVAKWNVIKEVLNCPKAQSL